MKTKQELSEKSNHTRPDPDLNLRLVLINAGPAFDCYIFFCDIFMCVFVSCNKPKRDASN